MDSDVILLESLFVVSALSFIVYKIDYKRTIRRAFLMCVLAHLVVLILTFFPIEWFTKGTGFLTALFIGTIIVGSTLFMSTIFALYESISREKTVRKTLLFLVFLVLSTVAYWALLKWALFKWALFKVTLLRNEYWTLYQILVEVLKLSLIWCCVFEVLDVLSDKRGKKALEDHKP